MTPLEANSELADGSENEGHLTETEDESTSVTVTVKVGDVAPRLTSMVDGVTASVGASFTGLTTMDRPAFIKVKGGGGTRPSSGPRLGIRPGYEEGVEGLKIEGVVEGGLAEKSGIKTGDNIVSVAGKPVKNIESYMEAMASTKVGTTIEIVVERGGKKVTVKVKLE